MLKSGRSFEGETTCGTVSPPDKYVAEHWAFRHSPYLAVQKSILKRRGTRGRTTCKTFSLQALFAGTKNSATQEKGLAAAWNAGWLGVTVFLVWRCEEKTEKALLKRVGLFLI